MVELQKELRRPGIQQRVFSYAKASPTEMVRKSLSTSEIQHRALTYLPDELLARIPEDDNAFSLFQGFQATLPESEESEHRKKHRRNVKGQRLLEGPDLDQPVTPLEQVKKERHKLSHQLEMMSVRKNMCSSEIREIDNKISNLKIIRKIVLDRLEGLEEDELLVERELQDVDNKLEDLLEQMEADATFGSSTPLEADLASEPGTPETTEPDTFMSESIYEKLPSPKSKRKGISRRKSMPIRHEHFEPGSNIREIQAHNDMITSLDFDAPFGTMVTSALDDTVRVWDLNYGRCIGLLEGHHASVRCLQVDDTIVATGSMDASIRLWDLSQADYAPYGTPSQSTIQEEDEADGLAYEEPDNEPPLPQPQPSGMRNCALTTLSGHVAEITALNFRGETLVSGSADKTLRQWDLTKGRCVQTLDVLWAAAQASATINTTSTSNPTSNSSGFRTTGSRIPDQSADFVGALQFFDAALACGTADGMVRLWDLRSGHVHRSLVGHTGAVSCLQFDETMLATGSADRSIRVRPFSPSSIGIIAGSPY